MQVYIQHVEDRKKEREEILTYEEEEENERKRCTLYMHTYTCTCITEME